MCLDLNEDETKSINVKQCPKCKTPIKKSRRYGNEIKKTLLGVEEVKKVVIDSRQRNVKMLRDRLRYVLELIIKAPLQVKGRVHRVLKSLMFPSGAYLDGVFAHPSTMINSHLSIHFRMVNENQVQCLERLNKLIHADGIKEEPDLTIYLNFIEDLFKWCLKEHKCLQQIKDADHEIKRLFLYNAVTAVASKLPSQDTNSATLLSEHMLLFRSGRKLSDDQMKEMRSQVDAICKKHCIGILTVEEKEMVIKAMGFSKGHWYKCPNGHVYAIGECGGAMQESTCPECKTQIGGTQHHLVEVRPTAAAAVMYVNG